MKVEHVLKAASYTITEGSPYGWTCYSPYAHWLDLENGISCVFDRLTREVYELQIAGDDDSTQYRWQDPRKIEAYLRECEARQVDPNAAGEDTQYQTIESEGQAIAMVYKRSHGEGQEDSIVQINMEDSEMLRLYNLAHERDMTLNEMVTHILIEQIERMKQQGNEEQKEQ